MSRLLMLVFLFENKCQVGGRGFRMLIFITFFLSRRLKYVNWVIVVQVSPTTHILIESFFPVTATLDQHNLHKPDCL